MRPFFLFFSITFLFSILSSLQGEGVTTPSPGAPSSDPWKLSLGASKPRPKNARTIIDNDDGAWFDDATNSLEFKGNVVVRDPQFKLFCDRLYIVMNPNRQGVQKIVATEKPPKEKPPKETTEKSPQENPPRREPVIIEQDNVNEQGELIKTIARAGEVTYEPATGNMTLKKKPEIQQGMNCQVATEDSTVMIINKKGISQTIGRSQIIVMDPNKR